MGVKGLWRLLLPIGRRISIETLEGQILAIDASIWLTQFLTVAARQREQELMGDGSFSGNNRSGKAYSFDYLVGFLRRLCKLRYQGVRPVLVFDGETPEIKKREIRERNKRRKRKLGESFYLGDNNNSGDVPTQEEEELLEATRRMAKRILAKQLKSGKLVTTKNKKLKAMKGSAPTNLIKGKSKVTIANASYAPGFYDPDATRVVAKSDTRKTPQQGSELLSEESNNDDHLLREDYNTNPLKEEINDWDKPIVIDSDNEDEKKAKTNTQKKNIAKFLKHSSKYHAGDGTKFKVESVADLPESARKDVIEDARKQRRLASRREFMGVASDPDALSSCQLRNFLKSTKLNQDIAAMAQQAKRKAEEEAKMTLGNGILFEKYNDDDKGNSYPDAGINRRQHYRSGNKSQKGRKKANLGMMRMFHHKDQVKKINSANLKTNKNESDDEHDFRKTRNNHYLSGGIQFVNSDGKNQNDSFSDEHLEEEKDLSRSHYESRMTDDDGGFAIAITDGSDKPKKQSSKITAVNKVRDDIIEIDVSSESDDNHSDVDDQKPAARKQEIKSSKSSQEIEDEALARALQNIEDEQINIDGTAEECIEIDGSEEGDAGDFFRNALPSPSREQDNSQTQQELDDARLARALQEAEYEDEEDLDGVGEGFLDEAKVSDNDETMGDGGGFLVEAKADNMQREDGIENGGGFLVSEKKGGNFEEKIGVLGGGFLAPSHKNGNSKRSHSRDVGGVSIPLKRDAKVGNIKYSSKGERQNRFAPSQTNAQNSIFDMMKQRKIHNNQTELLVCPESSEEEEEEDIDWEDGNNKAIRQREDTDTEKKLGEHLHDNKAPDMQEKQVAFAFNSKETHTNDRDKLDDDDGDRIEWDDGPESIEREPTSKDVFVATDGTKPTETTRFGKAIDDDDDEIDWEEGDDTTANDAQMAEEEPFKSLRESVSKSNYAEKIERSHIDDDEYSDEVDWEDGNDERNQSKSKVINLFDEKKSDNLFSKTESKNDINNHDEDDEVDWENGDNENEKSKFEDVDLYKERKRMNLSLNTTSNEPTKDTGENDGNLAELNSSIQNIEEASGSKRNTVQNSRYFGSSARSSSKPKTIDINSDSDDETDIDWEAGEDVGRNTMIEPDDWGVTKSHNSTEVAAALEQAQGTAANLTNWAGRAFRRAIAQHAIENGMEVPESAKPSALKKTQNDVDEDEPTLDEAKSNAHSPKRLSQASIWSRNPERKRSGENIDNFSWLETIDTANTYMEDYTVAPQEGNASNRLLDITAGGVTDEMRTEVMQLLRLFGIPYVVAPAEAEAQCVELERLGLVDGIVTEDSDTFVFGGQVVYKNIFDDKKYVEVYHAKDASEEMNLTHDSLIALAMLLGGDYTEGVKGVGIVNGMEVLQAFDVAQDCEAGLKRFRKWLDGFDPNDLGKIDASENDNNARSQEEQVFHRKHHTARTRWTAPKHFPDPKVLNAYLNPVVDTSTERFSWGIPDLDGLVAFCHGHMGWVAEETEKLIVPIIKQMEEGSMRQTRIDSFMRYEDGIKFAKIQSKRLRHVLGLSSNSEEKPQRTRIEAKAASTAGSGSEIDDNNRLSEAEAEDGEEASYSEVDEEMFAVMDAYSNTNDHVPNEANGKNTRPRKKMYNGKRTRSLAALSSASASTVAIASSSKSDAIFPGSSDGASIATVRQQHRKNLPKKAPPSYQKQSSMILEEEEKESAAQSAMHGDKSNKTYEVINPSMI